MNSPRDGTRAWLGNRSSRREYQPRPDRIDCSRDDVGDRKGPNYTRIHANKLDREAPNIGDQEVTSEHLTITKGLTSPVNQQRHEEQQRGAFIELRAVHALERRRQSLWKGDAPRQFRRSSIVIADKKASDASNRVGLRPVLASRRRPP
jgi:hypothetical protein